MFGIPPGISEIAANVRNPNKTFATGSPFDRNAATKTDIRVEKEMRRTPTVLVPSAFGLTCHRVTVNRTLRRGNRVLINSHGSVVEGILSFLCSS